MQNVVYHFHFADGNKQSVAVGAAEAAPMTAPPPWAALEFHQCPNCPLQPADTPHCPMTVQFIPLIAFLTTLRSYDQVDVQVNTPQRSIGKRTSVQRGVSPLMGLLAASSDCPHAAFLKPTSLYTSPTTCC